MDFCIKMREFVDDERSKYKIKFGISSLKIPV